MPSTWRDLLEELAPVFARRSTHRLFVALACGMILADRSTVVAMAAVDGTFFKRWGRKVFQARWAYDGAAQGGKKIAFGNVWVVAAIVVKLPACPSPVALPVLFRLWRGKGTASQVELAAGMVKLLAAAFPSRQVHGTGDAAFHGEPLAMEGTTWTTRLPANAVLYGPRPPRTGKRGRPRVRGDRLGTCAQIAAGADWAERVINVYGHDTSVQIADVEGLWHGSFKTAPGHVILVRDPASPRAYDLGLFTLDTSTDPAAIAERYSWRWPIEPWYRTKTSPSAADMLARLHRDFPQARICAIGPVQSHSGQINLDAWTCDSITA